MAGQGQQMDTDTQVSQPSPASSENSVYGPSDEENSPAPVAERPRPVQRPVTRTRRAQTSTSASTSQEMDVEEDDDEDTVTLTAYEVLARVEKAWLNEKLCTELLVPLLEETDCMQEQLRILEQNFKILSKRDIRLPIHQMEGERIRYLLTSYYRVRLMKIQKFPWFILNQDLNRTQGEASRLTPQERKFLKEYTENLESHLSTVGLQHMPAATRKVPEHLLNFQPNLDSYVFFKSHCDADIVIEGPDREEEDVHIEAGSRYVMRYRPVSHLLHSDKIELI